MRTDRKMNIEAYGKDHSYAKKKQKQNDRNRNRKIKTEKETKCQKQKQKDKNRNRKVERTTKRMKPSKDRWQAQVLCQKV